MDLFHKNTEGIRKLMGKISQQCLLIDPSVSIPFYDKDQWKKIIPSLEQTFIFQEQYKEIIDLKKNIELLGSNLHELYIAMDFHEEKMAKLALTHHSNQVFNNPDIVSIIASFLPLDKHLYSINNKLFNIRRKKMMINWRRVNIEKKPPLIIKFFLDQLSRQFIPTPSDIKSMFSYINKQLLDRGSKNLDYYFFNRFFTIPLIPSQISVFMKYHDLNDVFVMTYPVINMISHYKNSSKDSFIPPFIPPSNLIFIRTFTLEPEYFDIYCLEKDAINKYIGLEETPPLNMDGIFKMHFKYIHQIWKNIPDLIVEDDAYLHMSLFRVQSHILMEKLIAKKIFLSENIYLVMIRSTPKSIAQYFISQYKNHTIICDYNKFITPEITRMYDRCRDMNIKIIVG